MVRENFLVEEQQTGSQIETKNQLARYGDELIRTLLDEVFQSDLSFKQDAKEVFRLISKMSSVLTAFRSVVTREYEDDQERQLAFNEFSQVMEKLGIEVAVSEAVFDDDLDSEQIENLQTYYHDIANPMNHVHGYADFLRSLDMDDPKDASLVETCKGEIQNGLLDSKRVLKSFALAEGGFSKEPERLFDLMEYVFKLKARANSLNRDQALQTNFEVEGFDLDSIDDPESTLAAEAFTVSEFNVPSLVRIYHNVMQNTQKSYQVMEDQAAERAEQLADGKPNDSLEKLRPITNELRVRVLLQKDPDENSYISIVFDDDGIGFPQVENAEKLQSYADDAELLLFEPSRGKTAWSEKVSGTGIGLASFKEHVESLGGTFITGSRIDQGGKVLGARLELHVPLHRMGSEA